MKRMHVFLTCAATALAMMPFAASAQECPDFTAVSDLTTSATSDDLYSAQTVEITAGGRLDLAMCLQDLGVGYVQENPDLSLNFDNQGQGRRLDFTVTGECDTVLLLNLPNGEYLFLDDRYGPDPEISVALADSGRYDVWVGTYEPGLCASSLNLETWND